LSEIGLTEKKKLSISLAIDYIVSTKIDLPFDDSTTFSRIVNQMWATDMYTTHGQDAKSNTILSLTSWTDTSKGMTTSTLPLDTFNSTRRCSTRQIKIAPTKKITCHTLTPKHSISGATQNFARISSSAGSSNNS